MTKEIRIFFVIFFVVLWRSFRFLFRLLAHDSFDLLLPSLSLPSTMATTVPAVPREDGRLSSVDSDYNRYRNQQLEEQVVDYIPPPPSQPPTIGKALNRSRRTQKMGGYLSKLPPPSSSGDSSASFSSNSTSRTSSSSSVDDLPPSSSSHPVYILTGD